jgi:methionyl-tRNA formyltransferase
MFRVLFLGNGSKYSKDALRILEKYISLDNVEIHNMNKRYNFGNESYNFGISFLYSYLVPEKELGNKLWINFHPGPLPKYGGRNIAYHAIKNEEIEYGGTLHYMDKSFDSGDIIKVEYFKVTESDTAYDIFNKSCNVLLNLFESYVPKFLTGINFEGKRQTKTNYYKKIEIDDYISVSKELKNEIRAKMFPPFYPKIKIGRNTYIVVPEKFIDEKKI